MKVQTELQRSTMNLFSLFPINRILYLILSVNYGTNLQVPVNFLTSLIKLDKVSPGLTKGKSLLVVPHV